MYKTIQLLAFSLLVILMLSACHDAKPTNDLPVIDIETAYKKPPAELLMSEVVDDIEYIKLETNSENLINKVQCVAFSENYFALYETPSNRLMLFTKEGAYLHDIGRRGKGPGEYSSINFESLCISPNEEHIAFRSSTLLYLFTINGSFVGSLPYDQESVDVILFDNKGLLTVYRQKLNLPDVGGALILKLNTDLEVVDSLLYTVPDKSSLGSMLVPDLIVAYEDELYYTQVFNDTVFRINKNNTITPCYRVNLGGMRLNDFNSTWTDFALKYFLLSGLHLSDQYFFIKLDGRARKPAPGAGATEYVWFNRQSSTTTLSNGILTNNMDGVNDYWMKWNPKSGVLWDQIDISNVKPRIEKGEVNVDDLIKPKYYEELNRLLTESDLEDNPIIRVLRLK